MEQAGVMNDLRGVVPVAEAEHAVSALALRRRQPYLPDLLDDPKRELCERARHDSNVRPAA
jgi:hypothetical protein